MPTSKDILDDAAKVLKKNPVVEMALKDTLDQGVKDCATFGKAKAELATSIKSMKTAVDNLDDTLKELNAGLTALKKNEAVMKAPADAKAYDKLVDQFSDTIKSGMEYSKKISAQIKTADGLK